MLHTPLTEAGIWTITAVWLYLGVLACLMVNTYVQPRRFEYLQLNPDMGTAFLVFTALAGPLSFVGIVIWMTYRSVRQEWRVCVHSFMMKANRTTAAIRRHSVAA